MESKLVKTCDECHSHFYASSSAMKGLCPECAHYFYTYPNCDHIFKDKRCQKYYWDGSVSRYLQALKSPENKE